MRKVNRLGKNTPVRMKTRARTRISGKSYKEGMREIMHKPYIPGEAKKTLQKSGFGLRSRRSVSRNQFLKAVESLEHEGLLKHKAGSARKVFKSASSWEAWDTYRKENVQKRKSEYQKESREKVDDTERTQEAVSDTLEKERRRDELDRFREEKIKNRLSRSAMDDSDDSSITAHLGSRRGEKNKLLARIRSGGSTPDSGPQTVEKEGWSVPQEGPKSAPKGPPSIPIKPL